MHLQLHGTLTMSGVSRRVCNISGQVLHFCSEEACGCVDLHMLAYYIREAILTYCTLRIVR